MASGSHPKHSDEPTRADDPTAGNGPRDDEAVVDDSLLGDDAAFAAEAGFDDDDASADDDATGEEILDAGDEIIECLDEDATTDPERADAGEEPSEGGGDAELIDESDIVEVAGAEVAATAAIDDDESEGITGEFDTPFDPEPSSAAEGTDPLAAFAADPARQAEVADYAAGDPEAAESEEQDEPTGRVAPPQPVDRPSDAEVDDAAEPEAVAFAHDDSEEQPTGRIAAPFADEPAADPGERPEPEDEADFEAELEAESSDGGGTGIEPAPGAADDFEDATEAGDPVATDFDLEPIGRRRRSRRRPQRTAVEQEFIDESEATAPEDDGEAEPWDVEDETEPAPVAAREPSLPEPPLDESAGPAGRGDEREELNWSALPDDGERAMPDVGPTRVDGEPSAPTGDKTLIFDDPEAEAEQEPELDVPLLIIIQGEEEGREVELRRDELTLGRGPDNELVLPDIACSRRHAMIERQGEDWVVVDLNSGNGTLVNGERVQRAVLRDGDEIEVGSTVLEFQLPGQEELVDAPAAQAGTVPPRESTVTGTAPLGGAGAGGWWQRLTADPQRRKLLLVGGSAFGGLMLLLLLLNLLLPSTPDGPSPQEQARRMEMKNRQAFSAQMDKAKRLVLDKRWKDAKEVVLKARTYDPDNLLVEDYLETIKRELAASMALEQARVFIEEKSWETAVAALNRIPDDSEYKKEAERLKKEIDNQIVDDLLKQGMDLMREEKYSQAMVKFDEVHKRDPENAEVAVYKSQCEEQLEQAERDKRLAAARRARRRRNRRRRQRRQRQRPKTGLTGQALALYRNGELGRAIAKADASGTASQATLLRKFKSAYETGMRLAKMTGRADKAIVALRKAKQLDNKIGGGQGHYHDKLRKIMSKVYFVKGVDAYTRQRYPMAYQAFNKALKYKPDNDLAKGRLRELEKIAKKKYESAYVIKSTQAEKAIQELRTVMKIVPPNHIYYGKAQRLLKRLQGPLGSTGGGTGF
jgi:tetratricopeptide (TPR) repeat protein